MSTHEKLRAALFTVADSRGNNPHGTREDSVSEGRRLNRSRYETVEQVERRLGSAPPQPSGMPPLTQAQAPQAPQGPQAAPQESGLAIAGLLAVLAGGLYLLGRLSQSDEDEDTDDVDLKPALANPPAPVAAPAAQPPQVVVMMQPTSAAAPVALVAPVAPVANPEPAPAKRRARLPKNPVTPVAAPVASVSASSDLGGGTPPTVH